MSAREHGGKGPSVAQLEQYVRDKVRLEFLAVGGERFSGTLRWFDEHAFALTMDDEKPLTLLKSGVIGYRPATT